MKKIHRSPLPKIRTIEVSAGVRYWEDSEINVELFSDAAYIARQGPPIFILTIPTLEGDHKAMPGDYIIKGIKNEFYPCKPDIFEMTYEPAEIRGDQD
jgi:hypothetical protein